MADDILLIRPHSNMMDRDYDDGTGLRSTSARGNQEYPPLGICYLASMLKKHQFGVKCLDFHTPVFSISNLTALLKGGEVKIVGIYVLVFDIYAIAKLINLIRSISNVPIVLGGPTITHYPQTVRELHADYGIRGDAEYSMTALAKYLLRNEGVLKDIPGLVHYNGSEEIIGQSVVIGDLDSLPFPDFSVLPDPSYYKFPMLEGKITSMVSSRGCPFNCVFCGLTQKQKFNARSPENVVEEIADLASKGYRYVDFRDDCFSANMQRVKKLCKMMIDRKINILWGCETRIETVDDELLELMAGSGCHNVRFGIESVVPRVKKVINKTNKLDNLDRVLKMCRKLKMNSVGYFLIGHPSETVEEMKQTLNFVVSSNFDIVDVNICAIFPGADLFRIAKEEGVIGDDYMQKIISTGKIPVYVPKGVSFEQIERLKRKTMLRFYLKPRNILRFLRRIDNFKDLLRQIDVAFELLTWNLFGARRNPRSPNKESCKTESYEH